MLRLVVLHLITVFGVVVRRSNLVGCVHMWSYDVMRATTLRCAALAQVKSVFAHQRQRQRMCRRTHSGGPLGALRVDSHFCQMRRNCGPSRYARRHGVTCACTNEVMQRCGNQRRRRGRVLDFV
ncbi:hypothetical protein XAP412_770001 [Xanthomonas phaseoli pv. phaseoli]|uniref:Secreted protein n=1 Tax=Xanthomonas campestris pv. phaseoli TaxID=317013 RepID=A0AB38E535_XANCH|nr:hypothetical protein XAP6984_810001 [Xanthomonas phaseoli pv. phaseoli]SON90186.1 hypothetical protein XAP412_770001 [Xanthomonas phaseoli pv. phaseoli]SON92443.1 hypothetical protein XAP7430_770001 [Xanthomonas phaseoli pv. phaseoli]